MYRLEQDLAKRRRRYPRPLPTLPAICVIHVPTAFASASLPLGRYYPVILETDAEILELEAFLAAPRGTLVAPDLFDHRASQIATAQISFAHYAPAEQGWPHLLLCHWPPDYARLTRDRMAFARGAYTIELRDTGAELHAIVDKLMAVLSVEGELDIVTIRPTGESIGMA
jgi:hypothetical protein